MAVQYDVADLIVVLAGGTTGLGFSAAQHLVQQGAKVAIFGRSQEGLDQTLAQLGDAAVGIAADATQPAAIDQLLDLAVQKFGRVDALYHVAGGSGRSQGDGPLHELSDAGWHYTLDLNLTSVMLSNRAVIRQFLKQGSGGTIVNMGSVLGWSPSPQHFASHAYAAAKAAIVGLSKATASYYAKDNIRINVLAPALVDLTN